jgi:uncharacterized protein (DUF1684 family)
MSGPMTAPHEDEILVWRTNRLVGLSGPDGWLSVVGLVWLEEGDNPVGSDAASRVVLPGAPDRAGTIRVEAGRAVATFEPGSGVTVDGREVTRVDLADDSTAPPTLLRLGSLTFYLIRRDEQLAVRIKDAQSQARSSFSGIDNYPIAEAWRLEARFEPYDPPKVFRVPAALGIEETYAVPGALAFEHQSATHRLDAFLEAGETDLFLVFGDMTNASETYGGGRFLYALPPDETGIVVVDFNKAYNPPCVFTPFATCPLPPPQNRLPIRVEAGEKLYRGPTVASFV